MRAVTSYVYIVASLSRVLYVGVSHDLIRRMVEHRAGAIAGFTRRYKVNRLVYFESVDDIRGAILREKQLKGWTRQRKVELIESKNPAWEDLGVSIGLPPLTDEA